MRTIKQLLTQPSPQHFTQEETCFVVEEYIFQEKGKRVKINIMKGVEIPINNPFAMVHLQKEIQLLQAAFEVAYNKIKII